MAWIAFSIGVILGAFAGILAVGLCQMAASNNRDEADMEPKDICRPAESMHPVK